MSENEFNEAQDKLAEAFASLVAVAISDSASPFDAIPKISPIICAMQSTLMRCVLEVTKTEMAQMPYEEGGAK